MRSPRKCSVLSFVALMFMSSAAFGQHQASSELIARIDTVAFPTWTSSDDPNDEEAVAAYYEQLEVATRQQCMLILELSQKHPANQRLDDLLPKRWKQLSRDLGEDDVLLSETASYLDDTNSSAQRSAAHYWRARTLIDRLNPASSIEDRAGVETAINVFVDLFRADDRAPELMRRLAEDGHSFGTEGQRAAYRQLVAVYPESEFAVQARGKLRRIESIGKIVELEFDDAITGRHLSMSDLKGKVVVLDFWATWCGPCIAELPHLQELYARYHDDGLEVISISKDRPLEKGGYDALKAFVAERDMSWHHFYDGKQDKSEPYERWGVTRIPAVYIVDRLGVLRDVHARGHLDELIPQLLVEPWPVGDAGR